MNKPSNLKLSDIKINDHLIFCYHENKRLKHIIGEKCVVIDIDHNTDTVIVEWLNKKLVDSGFIEFFSYRFVKESKDNDKICKLKLRK